MSDNWVVQNLENALETWNEKLAEIWQLITTTPQDFKGGGIWGVIVNINGAVQSIGLALLVLFFVAGMVKTCGSFTEVKKPEHALKLFVRFAIAKGAITYGMELMLALFNIVQGTISTIMGSAGFSTPQQTVLPPELITSVEECGFFESIPLWAVTLIGGLFITVMSFILIMTVYGRFFKLYMYTALAPIPLSTFAGEQRKVGDLLIERNQQAPMSDEYPLMAFIANEGVAPKGERYDRSALVTDTVNKLYKKTEKGDFIYSSNNLETGSIGLNKYGKACISPVYSIFEPTGIADSDFLGRRLVRKDFINAMVKWRQGVIYGQWRIHESDFLKIEITVPSVEEQRKIGTYLDQLDHLITLHQRKPFLMKWRTSDANRNQTNRLVL